MLQRMFQGRTLSVDAYAHLMGYGWPGNLRELKNVLEYASSMCPQGEIGLDDLPTLRPLVAPMAKQPATTTAHASELLAALRAAHWNVSAVARNMGLSRMTLYRRMKRAGIVAPNRE